MNERDAIIHKLNLDEQTDKMVKLASCVLIFEGSGADVTEFAEELAHLVKNLDAWLKTRGNRFPKRWRR